jgi:glycosyltransferase involved in cell wall biosynthesis
MAAPEISVVVTTFERPWHLERVLEALVVQTVADRLEVIVTDDGSQDETPEVVDRVAARAPFPIRFVTQPHDGFRAAACRNRGVALATAPHLLLLDGDCVPPPRHIEAHLAAHRPGIVTNTYCVLFDQGTTEKVDLAAIRSAPYCQWAPGKELRQLRRLQRKALFYSFIGHPNKPRLRSGDVGMLRNDYCRVNGMDQRFRGWGSEDDDLGFRLRAAGLKIRYILDRTRTYHLWHSPAPSRPAKIGNNSNIRYLHRSARLTRCIDGLSLRNRADLVCALSGEGFDENTASRFLKRHGLKLYEPQSADADVEILFRPGKGSFLGRAAVRVLILLIDAPICRRLPPADIVVSPGGKAGDRKSVRIPLEDMSQFWSALGWQTPAVAAAA